MLLEGNRAKFQAHSELQERLLQTGERPIAEASPSDSICGIGLGPLDPRALEPRNWVGLNLLGQALMIIRDELKLAMLPEPEPEPEPLDIIVNKCQ